ncbi:MAG TPA: SRPBCC family protein [Candidatus Saccharimonadia bacterium]|jgi:ribosome-associated toxin RatA of RatAB toxin-antitoxin module|nr:SRPBCC family protein [Candidatus Saccharimonadia bacterium]
MASYAATVPVEFNCSQHTVYTALCDLGRYPQWNSGMTGISHHGPMTVGLTYTTTTAVMGRVNETRIKVLHLVPNESIVLESEAGLIAFHAEFRLTKLGPSSCSVTCDLRFEFSNLLFQLARPVVQALTETRIRSDLEALRVLLSA